MNSNFEATYLRDIELSQKLRDVGFCSDIDALFCDFNNFLPSGISEYKFHRVTNIAYQMKRPATGVIRALANASKIPFVMTLYLPGESKGAPWQYNVIPLNSYAEEALGTDKPVMMSERDFHLYHTKIRHKSEKQGFPELCDWIHPELKHLIE